MSQQTPLKNIIKIFNYKVSEEPLNKIELLLQLKDRIPDSIKSFKGIEQQNSLKESQKESEEFMRFHFKLHSINYAKMILNEEIIGQSILNPYEIPIEKTSEKISSTECFYKALNNEYPKRFYSKIKIQDNITEFTPCTITHEITHTQQESKKGIVNCFTNIEVLPIFLEILHYFEKNSISENQLRVIFKRLASLVDDISFLDKHNIMHSLFYIATINGHIDENITLVNTYIESTLKALNLSNIYQISNELIKREILKYIQDIFSGNKSVEDFLEHYDTTFDSSINQLQKRLNRITF